MRNAGHFSKSLTMVLIVFFLVVVLFPLAKMMMFLLSTDVGKIMSSDRFLTGLNNSLTATLVATLLSVSLAMVLAWFLERSAISHKGLWSTIFLVPMLIPSISHGTGLVILFGRNGLLTNLLHLQGSIYGFWGIVIGSVLYSFPVAFLMISDILRFEDYTPYEAASVLGIPQTKQTLAIFIPYIRKPMIAVVFAVFTQIITDYGVPLMVGGQYTTLPVIMYQDVIGMLEFGKGSVIGLVLLVPAVLAFIVDSLNRDKGSSSFTPRPFIRNDRKGILILAKSVCILAALFILLPIVAFVILSFAKKYPVNMSFTVQNIERAFSMNAGKNLINSLVIAIVVSSIGTFLAFVSAYMTARIKSPSTRILHLFSIVTLAIPGIVLGLSFVLFFKGTPLMGTLAILILVNLMHFFASPYLMMYNTLGKINPNLEDVGQTLGIPRLAIIVDVIVPQSKSTLIEMGTYFFVNSMMTISAVSFLATSRTQPLALMIPMFEAQMLLECTGVVSLIILMINLGVKGIVAVMKKQLGKR